MPSPILVRIVRLTLHPDKFDAFEKLFDEVSPRIRAVEGCAYLELLRDATFPNIVSTYSHWQSEAALETYRESELFLSTWERTRSFFIAPPVAHSYFLLRSIS